MKNGAGDRSRTRDLLITNQLAQCQKLYAETNGCGLDASKNKGGNGAKHQILALLLIVFLDAVSAAYCGQQGGWVATVERVIDGDTVVIRTEGGAESVRLAEIDAPEIDQPGGFKAAATMAVLLEHQVVTVQPVTTDRYGRLVAHLYSDESSIAQHMVEMGWAWAYRKYLKDESLLVREMEARQAGRGIWASHNEVVPPWEWRRRH